jgi:hypothetical protein
MLAELALRLLTPAGRMTRRLGLVAESAALWARGLRQRKAWAAHHARCRAVIAAVVEELASRRTVVVMGSGLMRDVPLALLRKRFARVLLVDLVHLPQIRLRAAAHRNVTLLTGDLGGVIGWLAGDAAARLDPVADIVADPSVDLVISANLLSQLAWPIEDWLESHPASALPPDLPSRCIAWHLQDLARFDARICLLSDIRTVTRNAAGDVLETFDLMRGVRVPPAPESWDWPVAPLGEAAGEETVHRVCAWPDFRASLAEAGRRG